MRALTLHQPYASLVVCGAKLIETRSWSTDYRGPIAVHAGQRMAPVEHPIWRAIVLSGIAVPTCYRGAVLARAQLVDVVPIYAAPHDGMLSEGAVLRFANGSAELLRDGAWSYVTHELPFGFYEPGNFAWVLDDIEPLAAPVFTRGKQGLWEIDDEELAA